jgi:hypothetical protein
MDFDRGISAQLDRDERPTSVWRDRVYVVARGFNVENSEGGPLRFRHAAWLCAWSGALVLVALAPTTVLADNPGNPGHHYGQIGNLGHHYGQFKHRNSRPSQTPGNQPSPPALHTQPASYSANETIGEAIPITNPGSSLTDGSLTGPVSTPVASPPPVPQRNLWLTAILLAFVLAANVTGGVMLVGRTLYFVLRRVRPLGITVPSRGTLQVEAA